MMVDRYQQLQLYDGKTASAMPFTLLYDDVYDKPISKALSEPKVRCTHSRIVRLPCMWELNHHMHGLQKKRKDKYQGRSSEHVGRLPMFT